MTTPSYASAHYTAGYDPELAAQALAPYAGGTIGLVGTYQMSAALADHLRQGRFSNSRFADASDLVDRYCVPALAASLRPDGLIAASGRSSALAGFPK